MHIVKIKLIHFDAGNDKAGAGIISGVTKQTQQILRGATKRLED